MLSARTPHPRAPGTPPYYLAWAAPWWYTRSSQPSGPGRDRGPVRGLLPRAALAAAAAALLGPALWAAGPASADTNPACPDASSSTATSCTYTATGEHAFTVPAGVTAVTITAVGAPGGPSIPIPTLPQMAGGNGAAVTATVPLPAGTTTLYAEVGGPGTAGNGNPGGFNGGGSSSTDGGGGGGASDVRTTLISTIPDSNLATDGDTRLVVAGGGGGGGACGGTGGTAGDSAVTGAGNGGDEAFPDGCANHGPGGNGGLGGPAGAGSNSGSLGQGGPAPAAFAGGGGGGYYGGGSGIDNWGSGLGGGGGAGSSFWAPDATGTPSMTEDTSGKASVVIKWTPPPADLSLSNHGAPDPVTSGQPLTYTLTATNTGGQDATGVTVTDPLPATAVFGAMTASQGSCTRTVTDPNKNKDGTLTCSLGTLPRGGTATVTITVTPTIKGTLANTGAVTASNVTSDSDDSAPTTVTVHGA